MSTYKELQNQIEKLQKEAEQARKTELSNAIARALSIMPQVVDGQFELAMKELHTEKKG